MIELVQDNELYKRLEEILSAGWFEIPKAKGYGGTGGPGKVLEHLLGLDGGNSDTPDGGKWEIKFHGGKSLLTLFHKDGLSTGHMKKVVAHYGWPDAQNRTSFRHTMRGGGTSPRGFAMVDIGDALSLTSLKDPIADLPYWKKDILINALAHKLRRLIVVSGTKSKGRVKYEQATLYWEPRTTEFFDAIVSGMIAIDFDARTHSHDRAIDGGKVRNHGTKFRIKASDLPRLYHHHKGFGDERQEHEMTFNLERIWAYQIDAGTEKFIGKEQDKSQKWAIDFVRFYENLLTQNCMPVVFAIEQDENGVSEKNEIEQTMFDIAFNASDRQANVERLVNELAGVIDGRTDNTLNIITVISDDSLPATKRLVSWIYPSDSAYDMQANGDLKLVEQIFIQKKLLRKAAAFTRASSAPSGSSSGLVYDKLARYNITRGSKYWREYLQCVPSITDFTGTDSVKQAIRQTLNQCEDQSLMVGIVSAIQDLQATTDEVTIDSIVAMFPKGVQEELKSKISPSLHSDSPFKIDSQVLKNYFKFSVRKLEEGITVMSINFEDDESKESKLNITVDENGQEHLSIAPSLVVSHKMRHTDV